MLLEKRKAVLSGVAAISLLAETFAMGSAPEISLPAIADDLASYPAKRCLRNALKRTSLQSIQPRLSQRDLDLFRLAAGCLGHSTGVNGTDRLQTLTPRHNIHRHHALGGFKQA